MPQLIDVKPIGAFIEYTLKPLIDYSHDLLDRLSKEGISANELLSKSITLFLIDKIFSLITNLSITGAICYTALKILGKI